MVRPGTMLSWQTKTRRRYARVTAELDYHHLFFLRDTDGKPIEFTPSSLNRLIADGIIRIERQRTKTGKQWKLLKITWWGCNLRDIRRRAIKKGMRLLSEDEVLEEVQRRRGN